MGILFLPKLREGNGWHEEKIFCLPKCGSALCLEMEMMDKEYHMNQAADAEKMCQLMQGFPDEKRHLCLS